MKESILRDFFDGDATPAELAADTSEGLQWRGRDSRQLVVESMPGEFELRPRHLIQLCDAVLDRQLEPQSLEAIGFALIASDQFQWNGEQDDGKRISDVLNAWSDPVINHDLTLENVRRWKRFLKSGIPGFKKEG